MRKPKHKPAVEIFRRRLALVLDERQWTQRDLAEKSGVNYVTISRVLAGKISPSLNLCDKIAKSLGVTVCDLTDPQK